MGQAYLYIVCVIYVLVIDHLVKQYNDNDDDSDERIIYSG